MVELKGKKNKDIIVEMEWKLTRNKVRILDNWDNEECDDFNEENWNRTLHLIKNLLTNLWLDDFDITIPNVLPHPDGTFALGRKNLPLDSIYPSNFRTFY